MKPKTAGTQTYVTWTSYCTFDQTAGKTNTKFNNLQQCEELTDFSSVVILHGLSDTKIWT